MKHRKPSLHIEDVSMWMDFTPEYRYLDLREGK